LTVNEEEMGRMSQNPNLQVHMTVDEYLREIRARIEGLKDKLDDDGISRDLIVLDVIKSGVYG
jgi:hypothetical protein